MNQGLDIGHTFFASLKYREVSWLQEEEARAVAHVCRIRSQVNAVVPSIARLPPEVLLEIFAYVRLAEDPPTGTRWISVSQVCQYWRNLAICKPSLWTCLAPWADEFLSLFMARNGDLPLTFHWEENGGRSEGANYQRLLELSSRCVRINVTLEETHAMELFIKRFQNVVQPWSQLESITLNMSKRRTLLNVQDVLCTKDGLLPFPRLQQLSLKNILPEAWSTISVQGSLLRTLHLQNQCRESPTLPLAPFLDMLCSLPLLEHLHLFNVPSARLLPEGVTAFPDPERTVNMGRLRTLRLDLDRACDIAYLLSPMQFPDTTVIDIQRWDNASDESILAALPSDKSRLSGHLDATTAMRVGHIRAFVGVFLSAFRRGAKKPFGNFFARCSPFSDSAPTAVLRASLFQLSRVFQNLVELELDLRHWDVLDISSSEWAGIFWTLSPRLKILAWLGDRKDSSRESADIECLQFFLRILTEYTADGNLQIDSIDGSTVPLDGPFLPRLSYLDFDQFSEPVQAALKEDVLKYLASRKSASLPPTRDLFFNNERWDVESDNTDLDCRSEMDFVNHEQGSSEA
ncbi:hypothetical protein EIP91_010403 [Steccherinum ochraceum]|uniref:F-box domain-containing protein n=1 Tax=Steccherinum ochraceum TaxID=92696 RepID=A0A4R0R8L2_9APHY|nr:hypothetical protein EIP91_010403 [Steccherinum ochraceum]